MTRLNQFKLIGIALGFSTLQYQAYAAITLTHSYHADTDISGDTIWSDSVGTANLNYNGNPTVPTPMLHNDGPLANSYYIGAINRAFTGNNYRSLGHSSTSSTFELWVRLDDPTANGNQQIIFESGGASLGASITYNNGEVLFLSKDSPTPTLHVSGPVSDVGDNWTQIVGVIDITPGGVANDSLSLYLNGQFAGSMNGDLNRWTGGNASRTIRVIVSPQTASPLPARSRLKAHHDGHG